MRRTDEELLTLKNKLNITCEYCREKVTLVFEVPKKYWDRYLANDTRVNIPFYTNTGNWFEYARCPNCKHWIEWIV